MSAREVRDDQHGTPTGYTYGCRCLPCRKAIHEWRLVSGVSEDALERVYAALEREADMDGIATASGSRLAELTGLAQPTAAHAVRLLDQRGRIRVIGTTGANVYEVELVEAS